jgi:Flp pilus assembly protein TadD
MTAAVSNDRFLPWRHALLAAGITGAVLVSGCSSQGPRPDRMADQARDAIDKGKPDQAIAPAEQAVLADGRNPGMRLLLANAYLRAGRFQSARQAYADAIELGDDSSRAALGLVMADLALGHNAAALDTLNTYGDVLGTADLGLALVMAGHNQRGIDVLMNGLRNGQNTPRMRQNLAYAYALSGLWGEAKMMVGQDVPAAQVDARLQSWATMSRPQDSARRVAGLIGAPLVTDAGQPEALALAHFPAAPGSAPAHPVVPAREAAAAELPPLDAPPQGSQPIAASGALARVDLPPAKPMPPVPLPVVRRPVPAAPARPPAMAAKAVPNRGLGTHLVQLGAFNSQESARRAWQHFSTRDPRLAGHPSLITHVTVNGREFWRVQAAGFAGRAPATSLCGTLRARGGACLVMAVNAAATVAPIQTAAAHGAPARPGPVLARR